MKVRVQLGWVLFSILLLWGVLTWPLPRYAAQGIPRSVHAPAGEQPRSMVSGDHLQLLYHFWLLSDMVGGGTPWMYNLYEFNTGDDAERYRPGAYFAPFSWAFAVGERVAGRAVGWHLATFLSLFIAFWSSWRLARRYTDQEVVAWAVALMVVAFPYRWYNLLSGSPTGFGMAWTPLLMLGLDRAIRDGSWRGGWLAFVAMIFSGWAEKHVMFFNVLLIPGWGLVVWVGERPWRKGAWLISLRRCLAALPAVAGVVCSYLYANLYTAHLGSSTMAKGRSAAEIIPFSPRLEGFWNRYVADISSQIFSGWVLPALVLLCLLVFLYRTVVRRDGQALSRVWLMLGLVVLGGMVLMLATGPNGRGVGRDLFEAARSLLPPYRMIRQAAKVMLLMPGLLVPVLAVGLSLLPRRTGWALLAGLLVLVDVAVWARPGLCLLERSNQAYAAVAADAVSRQEVSRALVVPLWPGDSHYASVYEYYASLYRVRLANGYSPVVGRAYIDEFFGPYQTANQGSLSDEQLDDLTRRGLRYVILHEDLFPEKVSPFPVAVTLHRLRQHPRLELLAQDGATWAFRILDQARSDIRSAVTPAHYPARRWEAESVHRRGGLTQEDPQASGGKSVLLRTAGDKVEFSLSRLAATEGLAWWICVRGEGALQTTTYAAIADPVVATQSVKAAQWTWIQIPVRPVEPFGSVGLALRGGGGAVEVDRGLLADEGWPLETPPGWSARLPAAELFHAGASDAEGNEVCFHPESEPNEIVLYGPRMPLSPGSYLLTMEFTTAAPVGTPLGILLAGPGSRSSVTNRAEVVAGQTVSVSWTQSGHELFYAGFQFARMAPLEVQAIRITRTDGP